MIDWNTLFDRPSELWRIILFIGIFLYWHYGIGNKRYFGKPLVIAGFLVAVLVWLPKVMQQTILLALCVGFGWSLRLLLMDVFAGFILTLEHKIPIAGWVHDEQFSGQILQRYWRGVLIQDADGRECVVPNHVFLQRSIRISPPGQYGITLRFWVPEGLSVYTAEERLRSWLPCSPWLADGNFVLYPDPSNPRILIVRMQLLHADHEDNVIRSLRRQLEKSVQMDTQQKS